MQTSLRIRRAEQSRDHLNPAPLELLMREIALVESHELLQLRKGGEGDIQERRCERQVARSQHRAVIHHDFVRGFLRMMVVTRRGDGSHFLAFVARNCRSVRFRLIGYGRRFAVSFRLGLGREGHRNSGRREKFSC